MGFLVNRCFNDFLERFDLVRQLPRRFPFAHFQRSVRLVTRLTRKVWMDVVDEAEKVRVLRAVDSFLYGRGVLPISFPLY